MKCHTVTRGNVGKGRNGGGDSNALHDVRLVSERLRRIANDLEGADDLGREYESKVPGCYICSSSQIQRHEWIPLHIASRRTWPERVNVKP